MTPLAIGVKALGASAASVAVLWVMQAVTAIAPEPMEIVVGVITGAILFLGTMVIRGNSNIAGLKVYAERNKADIDKLDMESRTVEKRITESRHLVRNECQQICNTVEDRVMVRVEENQRGVVRLEERLLNVFDTIARLQNGGTKP